jgi:hypothetical protein
VAEDVLAYIEKRLAYLGRLYEQRLRQIDAHEGLSSEEKDAWKGALWEKTNARTDELKRVRKIVKPS